jgi:hypothetical protein
MRCLRVLARQLTEICRSGATKSGPPPQLPGPDGPCWNVRWRRRIQADDCPTSCSRSFWSESN